MQTEKPILRYEIDLENLSPWVNIAHFAPSRHGLNMAGRTINDFELVYSLGGGGVFRILEMEYSFGEGDIILTPPWIWHGYETGNAPAPHYAVHFSIRPGFEERYRPNESLRDGHDGLEVLFAGGIRAPIVIGGFPTDQRSLFVEVIKAKENYDLRPRPTAAPRLRMAMMNLLCGICEHLLGEPADDESSGLRRSGRLIDERYTGNMTVPELAAVEGLTPNYYSTLFKKIHGVGPVEHITRKRVSLAKKLIRETNLRIAEVAEKCGYDDPYYFSKTFKKYAGLPPSDYRRISSP